MSRSLFLDTSAWFAALSSRDQWHSAALRAYTNATRGGYTFVTTTLVIAEMHALLVRWRDAEIGRRFLAAALDTPSHSIVVADVELVREAIDRWIAAYSDQPFSLCDAVSFEVMRRERLERALAFDKHFEIAGFEVVR